MSPLLRLETTPMGAPVSLLCFVDPPGDVALFSRGTSNHFLHPPPDAMPHHSPGVSMRQTGGGVHAGRCGLPAAAGTHRAHSSGHQSWVLPTSTSRVLPVTWRIFGTILFTILTDMFGSFSDSGSKPAQSFRLHCTFFSVYSFLMFLVQSRSYLYLYFTVHTY